jgi:hypothetical protein
MLLSFTTHYLLKNMKKNIVVGITINSPVRQDDYADMNYDEERRRDSFSSLQVPKALRSQSDGTIKIKAMIIVCTSCTT